MTKQHYFFKLIPPRPTFPHDMTDDERRLMDEHGAQRQVRGRCRIQNPKPKILNSDWRPETKPNPTPRQAPTWRAAKCKPCRRQPEP
jgi:hypothetical protein